MKPVLLDKTQRLLPGWEVYILGRAEGRTCLFSIIREYKCNRCAAVLFRLLWLEIRLLYLTCTSAYFNGAPCNLFCFPASCKCSLIAQRAELCTSMKNYQQALHDADVLCRNKPHWPAVRCLHIIKSKMKTACSWGFSLWWGQSC